MDSLRVVSNACFMPCQFRDGNTSLHLHECRVLSPRRLFSFEQQCTCVEAAQQQLQLPQSRPADKVCLHMQKSLVLDACWVAAGRLTSEKSLVQSVS